jgi:glycosyltransferase involved in cell wall biosynthesis
MCGRSRHTARITVAAHEIAYDGGQERVTAELISGLLERGYEVTAVAWRCDVEPHPRLQFRRVPGPRRPASVASLLFYLVGSLRVWRARGDLRYSAGPVIANRVDVVTVHFCSHHFQKVVGVKRHSRPGLAYRLNEALYNVVARAGERWTYVPRRVTRLVSVSSGVARELELFFPSMRRRGITVIANGVDGECFRPDSGSRRAVRAELGLREDAMVAVFLGGDWERKGLRHAIGGVAGAPDWHLLVVGEGNEEAFRRVTVKVGAEDRVLFVGKRLDSWRYLAAGDAFVLPSSYEAFGLSAFEAGSSGLPLLGTRVNGLDELIIDGENGFFVDRDPAAIADRLSQLGADPQLRRWMSDNARTSASRYSWADSVDSYVKLFEELQASCAG